jgi:hypothetical protein
MSSPTSPDDARAEIPGFATTSAPEEFHHPDQSLPESADLSTMSPPPLPPKDTPRDHAGSSTGRSSPESIDSITDAFSEELGNFGAGAFELLGVAMNKVMSKRTKTRSTLWLATDDELEAFGEAAARIADRKIPEQFKEGDAGDAIVMASVLISYGGRNLAGITREDVERGAIPAQTVDVRPAPAPQAYPGPETAPPPRAVPPPPAATVPHATGGVFDTPQEPTPAPPDVISPLI